MKPLGTLKTLVLGVCLWATAGCEQLKNQDAAVQQAIQDHLAERSDLAMDQMVMEVQQVSVEGDEAKAEVVFAVPGEPQMRMTFQYHLHREGGQWVVESGRPVGMPDGHPTAEGAPMGDPHQGSGGDPQQLNLPEGHPPMGMPAEDPGSGQ